MIFWWATFSQEEARWARISRASFSSFSCLLSDWSPLSEWSQSRKWFVVSCWKRHERKPFCYLRWGGMFPELLLLDKLPPELLKGLEGGSSSGRIVVDNLFARTLPKTLILYHTHKYFQKGLWNFLNKTEITIRVFWKQSVHSIRVFNLFCIRANR